MSEDAIDRGVAVVAAMARFEPSVADVVDALEAVVDAPGEVRRVLARAEREGVIERDAARITRPRDLTPPAEEAEIVTKEGEFSCRRCGRPVTEGHFLATDAAEVGPYGSTCVRRVTGRE